MRLRFTLRSHVRAALIAAVYVALCLALAPFSYGPVQVRAAEALTLLPVLCPEAVIGVTLGCLVANLFTGMWLDVLVGTAATLLAALATRRLRKVRMRGLPLAASLPPVVINALLVGAMLTVLYLPPGSRTPLAFAANMASVAAGQIISCCVLGVGLVRLVEKNTALRRLFSGGQTA